MQETTEETMDVDLQFFPTLREMMNSPDALALRERNQARLLQARQTDGNYCRAPVWACDGRHCDITHWMKE